MYKNHYMLFVSVNMFRNTTDRNCSSHDPLCSNNTGINKLILLSIHISSMSMIYFSVGMFQNKQQKHI